MNVLITGLPLSGRGLVQRMIRSHNLPHVNTAAYHFRDPARIDNVEPINDYIMQGEFSRVIVMIRREEPWEAEFKAVDTPYKALDYADMCRMHYDTLRSCAGIQMMVVCYEDIVRLPDYTGRQIAGFLGFKWAGWGEELYDGNAAVKSSA